MSQATCAVHAFNSFFKLFIKQAKMYFVFKVSFLLHRVANQNFKKSVKFLLENNVKTESKKALTHLARKFKKWSDFHETSYTLPKGQGKNVYEILSLYLV